MVWQRVRHDWASREVPPYTGLNSWSLTGQLSLINDSLSPFYLPSSPRVLSSGFRLRKQQYEHIKLFRECLLFSLDSQNHSLSRVNAFYHSMSPILTFNQLVFSQNLLFLHQNSVSTTCAPPLLCPLSIYSLTLTTHIAKSSCIFTYLP